MNIQGHALKIMLTCMKLQLNMVLLFLIRQEKNYHQTH